jgi:HK97 gp10 family phage protein
MSAIAKAEVDLKEFEAAMSKLSDAARDNALREALDAGGFELEAEIKMQIDKQKLRDTGNLINSIQKKKTKVTGNSGEVQVGTNVIYAAIHEFGGVIRAKNAKALRFRTKDGQWHTVKSVTIPARPYMRPAVDEGKGRVEAAVRAVLKRNIEAAK